MDDGRLKGSSLPDSQSAIRLANRRPDLRSCSSSLPFAVHRLSSSFLISHFCFLISDFSSSPLRVAALFLHFCLLPFALCLLPFFCFPGAYPRKKKQTRGAIRPQGLRPGLRYVAASRLPDSPFPVRHSLFPVPSSLFPISCSLLPAFPYVGSSNNREGTAPAASDGTRAEVRNPAITGSPITAPTCRRRYDGCSAAASARQKAHQWSAWP